MGNAEYRDPVLRLGIICAPFEGMNFAQAEALRDSLAKIDFLPIWRESMDLYGFSDVGQVVGEVSQALLDGPAVRWPDVEVWIAGRKCHVSPSATVCLDPRSPKLWVRIALADPGYIEQLDVTSICSLYDTMHNSCTSCIEVVFEKYREKLEALVETLQKGGTAVQFKLEKTHTIRIKTAVGDLGNDAESLKYRKFSMSDVEADDSAHKWVRDLVDVASQGNPLQKASEYRWIAMSVRNVSGLDLIGLYAAHVGKTMTDMAGFVHHDSNSPLETPAARIISRKFQQNLAAQV